MPSKPNALQAVLERTARTDDQTEPKPQKRQLPKRSKKPSRENTTLVGGHFPPNVARQLGIIAAEEGTTKLALLAEALDLLFVKKGKTRISEL